MMMRSRISRLVRRALAGAGGGAHAPHRALLLASTVAAASLPPTGPGRAQVLLYENRLPDGYAYVRFANTMKEPLGIKPSGFADALTLGNGGPDRVSAYYTIEKVADRTFDMELSQKDSVRHASFKLKPGTFNTVLVAREGEGDAAKVVVDQAEINRSRARLAFYNAVPDCAAATLQLDPGGSSVFSAIPPDSMRGRSVNPLAHAAVRAGCGTSRTAPLDLGQLDAGGQYSIWLMAPSGTTITFMSENTIAPYLR